MEEKRTIKKMAFLIIIIANIILLIAVINSVTKAFKSIEPGKISQTAVNENKGDFVKKDEDVGIKENKEYLHGIQNVGIGDEIEDSITSSGGDLYKVLEIGLFAIGIFLFLLGVFILRAVKRMN